MNDNTGDLMNSPAHTGKWNSRCWWLCRYHVLYEPFHQQQRKSNARPHLSSKNIWDWTSIAFEYAENTQSIPKRIRLQSLRRCDAKMLRRYDTIWSSDQSVDRSIASVLHTDLNQGSSLPKQAFFPQPHTGTHSPRRLHWRTGNNDHECNIIRLIIAGECEWECQKLSQVTLSLHSAAVKTPPTPHPHCSHAALTLQTYQGGDSKGLQTVCVCVTLFSLDRRLIVRRIVLCRAAWFFFPLVVQISYASVPL